MIGPAMLLYMILREAFVTDAASASSDWSFLGWSFLGNVAPSAFVSISAIPLEVMPAKT